jgi:hypothetical protein
MVVLDTTIVNVALPSIREDLGFTETSLVWVVNAYMLTFGGFLLLGGRLGDLYGHRRLFLTIKLDFLKPFEAHKLVEFTLEPKGDATNVTWAIHGPMPYISKVVSIFCSMDSMIGKDFEAGLANLKASAEK